MVRAHIGKGLGFLGTAPGLGESISGAILSDESIRQSKLDGTPFAKVLIDAGIVPGIKVDAGAHSAGLSQGMDAK